MLSHICTKTSRNTHQGELGIQRMSMRPRVVEVEAMIVHPPRLNAAHRWVLFLESVALNPRKYKGRIKGVCRKPINLNPILDFDRRIAWISEQTGWSTRNVTLVLRDAEKVLTLQARARRW